ncbi:MAG: lactonase family protein [Chloroflexi bacterium]|nr:lactonase family protein [Chloroflexota bacterium]
MTAAQPDARPLVTYFGSSSRGRGIFIATLDTETGVLTDIGGNDIPGRGWLALSPDERFLYAAVDGDAIAAFAVDAASGQLTPLNSSPTGTSSVSHISVDPSGKYVVGASYSGGAVCVVSIDEDGSLGAPTDVRKHEGEVPGPHPDQTQAKAHQCPFDLSGKWVVVNDLGLDRTYVYSLDTANGTLTPNDPPYIQFARGRGPRHIAFHPSNRFAYVINELSAEMTALAWDAERGVFEELHTESTLPPGWTGRKWTAQVIVHPSGKWVYGSNRGSGTMSDDIVIFAIDQATGRMTLAGHAPTLGQVARNFNIEPGGRFLVCVHQDSDNAVVFSIDQDTGALTPTGPQLTFTNAVCTIFAPSVG